MDLLFYVNEHLFNIVIMFSRITGLFLLAPIYANKFIPTKIKVLLSLLFSIMLSGNLNYPSNLDLYYLFCFIIIEFLFGLLIGFMSSLFLKTINMLGACIDFVMGFGMMNSIGIDGSSDNISATLLEYVALILFFAMQGHIYLFYIISKKIDVMNLIASIQSFDLLTFLIKAFMFIISNGIKLSIPFLLVFIIIDLCLGIINKSYSSFNVFLFSIPIKALLFVILTSYYIYSFIYNFEGFFSSNITIIEEILNLLN